MTKYKLDNVDKYTIGLLLSIVVAFTILLYGCNAYKQIEKHEPQSVKDTARLIARYVKTIPSKPPVIKQGKTIVVQKLDSINYYKRLADSLRKLPPRIKTVQDSCGKESVESYDEGYHFGYKLGLYDAKQNIQPSTHQTDTVEQDSPETLAQLYNQKVKAEQDAKTIASLITDKITLKAQKQAKNSENWFWRVVALLAIGWAVFKPKIIKIVNQLKGKL